MVYYYFVVPINSAGTGTEQSDTGFSAAPIPNQPPVVSIIGGNQTIADTDAAAGESVNVSATATDNDGTVVLTEWLINNSVVATGLNPTLALPDGDTDVTFRATDDDGDSTTDTVTLTVQAPANQPPLVGIIGGNQTIADTDATPGESVSLSATATDNDGTVVLTEWLIDNIVVGTGLNVTGVLLDGNTVVAVPLTSKLKKQRPHNVVIPQHQIIKDAYCKDTLSDSVALADQIRTLDKARLEQKIGRLSQTATIGLVETGLAFMLGISN